MAQHKIAHITTIAGSLEALLLNQMIYLRQAGYEVIGVSTPGQATQSLDRAGIRHIPVKMTRSITPFADLYALFRLYKLFRQEHFTIVHTHTAKPSLIGQLAAKLAGVPVIVNTVHGYYFHEHMPAFPRWFFKTCERVAGHCSDLILYENVEDIEASVAERIGTPEKRRHLGAGIDLNRFDPNTVLKSSVQTLRSKLSIPSNARIIGFVGRLAARRKGFTDFLSACSILAQNDPDIYVVVVGEPDKGKADAVQPNVARRFGLWDRCRFLGSVANDRMPDVYCLFDVLVLPSLFEGLPRVLMEASAMGIPIVASNVKGNRAAVQHSVNGLLVPFGDVVAIANAIQSLLKDPCKARQMGKQGRRIATDRFDESKIFSTVKREYHAALQRKGLL